uniref:Uncharacterized protein n=1 Tax=Arundo donax TaxID=35708 RepID=A0A0A9H9Z8_ARUDO
MIITQTRTLLWQLER